MKGGDRKSEKAKSTIKNIVDFSPQYLSHARTVLMIDGGGRVVRNVIKNLTGFNPTYLMVIVVVNGKCPDSVCYLNECSGPHTPQGVRDGSHQPGNSTNPAPTNALPA
jgi:hypothetical protein